MLPTRPEPVRHSQSIGKCDFLVQKQAPKKLVIDLSVTEPRVLNHRVPNTSV